jgi:defect in organelle trafficking protein DotC
MSKALCFRRSSLGVMLALALFGAGSVMAQTNSSPVPPATAEAAANAAAPMAPQGPKKPALPGDTYWQNQGGSEYPPSTAASLPPPDVNGVLSDQLIKDQKAAANAVPWARASAIQGAAVTYGVQAGMASRAYQINESLDRRAGDYDRVFNFNDVMLEPGFLPPVISEGRDAYNQPSSRIVRAADRIYKIEFPARLVSAAPTWRDYLPVSYNMPQLPDATVLPKTTQEKSLWDAWVRQGWDQGVTLANQTFEANDGRLKRDFEGMIRYKALYEQGVVSKPILSKSTLGVTGGGSEMAINDRVYEVTKDAGLDPNTHRWSTALPKTASGDSGQPDPVPPSQP